MAYDNAADEIEAMLNGTHVSDNDNTNSGSEEFEETEYGFEEENDFNQDDLGDENAEETETEEESEEEESNDGETNHDGDDQNGETQEEESDETEETEDGNSQEEDESNTDGEESETKTNGGDQSGNTVLPNQEEFDRLKSFYEKVTGEFKANGKTIKGFNDPDKIIQGLQKAIGFEEKNAVINKHKKFLAPLKERGFLENPEKFNLALSIIDGDKEAIKQHLKNLEINPILDLELDNINYQEKQHLPSDSKVIYNETMEYAKEIGIEEKLSKVLADDFDNDGFNEFIKNPKVRDDLISHIQDGTYDLVKEKIDEIRLSDLSGGYKSLSTTNQYRYAINVLAEELASKNQRVGSKNNENSDKANIKNTVDNIMPQAVVLDDKRKAEIAAEEEAKYREEVRRKIESDKARKEAASVSKTKSTPKVVKKKEEFDPLELTGDDFKDYFNSLMR